MKSIRLINTLRHLRMRQFTALMLHRARQAFDDPARLLKFHVPPCPDCVWNPLDKPLLPLQTNTGADLRAAKMSFLHQPLKIGWPPDWNYRGIPRLWQYNLHYFDWLWALGFNDAATVVCDWIDRHPPARGAVGWEPYPTSLRLVNWCSIFFARDRARTEQQTDVREKIWTSIVHQARWLDQTLERHLLGNHLLENACALTVVGSCFAGDEARRWYERGVKLLREQLPEQLLSDGGHFERSPMYHCRVVYDLCVLRNLGPQEVRELVEGPLRKAIQAMKLMCHPDGRIALLNDSAWDVYNHPSELARSAGDDSATLVGPFALPQTGYYGWRNSDGSYIICDAGPIGPDYQPGHGHGDILSFEMSLRGHRVIVDSGVFDYQPGVMRDFCRSTSAHNTIEIDGKDQAEFWGAFRVGRRGQARDVLYSILNDGFELSAWHDGYRRIRGSPIHQRKFRWNDKGQLSIHDALSSDAEHCYASRLHLHPDCSIAQLTAGHATVKYPAGMFTIDFQGQGNLVVEESFFCPQFGQKIRNQTLAWHGRLAGRAEVDCRIMHGD